MRNALPFARMYVMEFYARVSHVGTRSLISQSADDAHKEARYFLKDAAQYNPALTHAEIFDVRDDVESVGTVKI
jgi:hypothetical protein